MLRRGKTAVAYRLGVAVQGLDDLPLQVGEAPDEARLLVAEQAQQVFGHQYLPVTGCRCTDTDGRNAQLFTQLSCHGLGDAFEHYREGAGGLHGLCIPADLGGAGRFGSGVNACVCWQRYRCWRKA